MPIYEYKCENCGHELEILQKMSDAPAKTCPECNQDALKKMISAAAFKLKGTGWYETDFKDKKSKTDKKTESKSGNDSKSDGDKKKETKTSTDSKKSTTKTSSSE